MTDPELTMPLSMTLRVLLPSRIFAEETGVTEIVAETRAGSFGLLPQRLDCVAALVPGILIYETAAGEDAYIAVDEGMLVKTGPAVLVSVRRAIGGTDLARLRDAVEREFMAMDAEETGMRSVMAKLEAGFVTRLANLRHA